MSDREMEELLTRVTRDMASSEILDEPFLSIRHPEGRFRSDDGLHVYDNGATEQLSDSEPFTGDQGEDTAFQTDQEHLFEQIGESQINPDTGEPLDELDSKTLLAHMRRQERDAKAPYSNSNPPSWEGGNLGLTVTCLPGAPTTSEGITKQCAYWPGEDSETRPVTVIAMPPVPLTNPVAATGLVRAFMRLTFATASGQFQRVDVDIGTGTMISVCCSSMSVEVGLDGGSTVSAQITAAISFGSPLKNNQAVRTYYNDNQAAGAGNTVIANRPKMAATIAGFERQIYSAQYMLTFLDQNNNQIGQRVLAPNADLVVPILLPNDVRAVQIENDGGQTLSSRLVWGLIM